MSNVHVFLCALLTVAAAAAAQAQTPRSVSGSFAQFFLGQSLAIPHPGFGPFDPAGSPPQTFTGMAPTFMGTPVGGAKPTPYAFAVTSNSGATLRVPPRRITHGAPGNPQPGRNRPVFSTNPAVFQVYTQLSLQIPRVPPATPSGPMSDSAFFAGGRTGANVVSWCPGLTATLLSGGNPGCAVFSQAPTITLPDCTGPGQCPHSTQTLMAQIPGSVRYRRTAGQVGGAARGNLGGTFHLALNPFGATMTNSPATVFFVGGGAPATPAIGGEFGAYDQHAMPSLMGIVVRLHAAREHRRDDRVHVHAGAARRGTRIASFGVPFTGGQLVLSVPNGVFTLTGSDNRTPSGAGNITLVGGAVSLRAVSGPGANRGILHLTLPEPPATADAVAALLALLGCHQIVRRRRTGSGAPRER